MTNEELIKEIPTLPAEAKRQIERIIERVKSSRRSPAEPKKHIPLSEESFCGMWKDREDLKDSVAKRGMT